MCYAGILLNKENLIVWALVQESSAVTLQKESHSHKGSHVHTLQIATGAKYSHIKSLVQQQGQYL